MSNLVNAAEVNGRIGAGSLILNDYKLKISDIEGGHRLSVERGADVQTMDVMDGAGGTGGDCGCAEADSLLILSETAIAESITDGNGMFLTDNNGEIFIF